MSGDLRAEVLQAVSSLHAAPGAGGPAGPAAHAAPAAAQRPAAGRGVPGRPVEGAAGAPARPTTSGLSLDETLLLHSIGWEPVDLVCGVAVASVPYGVWTWGSGEIGAASAAYALAVQAAGDRVRAQCSEAGGHGVVGVTVEAEVSPHHVDVALVGTAVRPVGGQSAKQPGRSRALGRPFVSDLSGRDFSLLLGAGWHPVGLACGASFVYVPRRAAGAALRQTTQNVELTNFTEAMYAARSSALERMQRSATDMGGQGIVAVQVAEGPVSFARHAVGFTAWGTAVRLEAESHVHLQPQVVLPLDDVAVRFEAGSLRGG